MALASVVAPLKLVGDSLIPVLRNFDTGNIAFTDWNFPPDSRSQFSVTTSNTWSPVQFSLWTIALIVDDGEILLCVAKPKPNSQFNFNDFDTELNVVSAVSWNSMLLRQGSILYHLCAVLEDFQCSTGILVALPLLCKADDPDVEADEFISGHLPNLNN
ncbi:hypothetical protein K438DRAFT_1774043 [Mycena galopus ATCC 62051]|nr:hypothetical protein K438DRAFT_1774043 [Mycena galopus ATCC 62051]